MKIHLFTKIAIALFSVMIVYIMRNLLKALTEGAIMFVNLLKGSQEGLRKTALDGKIIVLRMKTVEKR